VPRAYPVHEAKAKLSEILRKVKQGRSVTISERGREIARIVPIERATDLPSRLEELARDGDLLRREPAGRIRPLARRPGALRRFLRERD
jgi:prevent-host-death family protein